MFSTDITESDAFLEMPQSTQALYFHLGMHVDHEGFVGNPKQIMRTVNSSEDDMKLLITKRFVIFFASGVVVIKHHNMHNAIRKDRFIPTVYTEERKKLIIKPNGAYTEVTTIGQPSDDQVSAQVKVSKVKISKEILRGPKPANQHQQFLEWWVQAVKKLRGVTPIITGADKSMLGKLMAKHKVPPEQIEKMALYFLAAPTFKNFAPTLKTLCSAGIVTGMLNQMKNPSDFWKIVYGAAVNVDVVHFEKIAEIKSDNNEIKKLLENMSKSFQIGKSDLDELKENHARKI